MKTWKRSLPWITIDPFWVTDSTPLPFFIHSRHDGRVDDEPIKVNEDEKVHVIISPSRGSRWWSREENGDDKNVWRSWTPDEEEEDAHKMRSRCIESKCWRRRSNGLKGWCRVTATTTTMTVMMMMKRTNVVEVEQRRGGISRMEDQERGDQKRHRDDEWESSQGDMLSNRGKKGRKGSKTASTEDHDESPHDFTDLQVTFTALEVTESTKKNRMRSITFFTRVNTEQKCLFCQRLSLEVSRRRGSVLRETLVRHTSGHHKEIWTFNEQWKDSTLSVSQQQHQTSTVTKSEKGSHDTSFTFSDRTEIKILPNLLSL